MLLINIMNLLFEAIAVGIVVLAVGTLVGFIMGKFMKVDLPKACRQWNKNHIMELSLFITGALTHVIFELLGLNKWYCIHGRACKK